MEKLGRVLSEKLGLKGKRGENPPLDPQPWVGTKATFSILFVWSHCLTWFYAG